MSQHYVSFSAEINPTTTEHLINGLANLHNNGATQVTLLFSTPGGSIMNGFNIYNVMRALPFELTIHNVGNVDSIGNVIFLGGAKRFAAPHSTFMFHGGGFDINGALRLTEPLLKDHLDSLTADHKRMGSVLEQHTTLTGEQVVALFEHASTKDAAWAENVGMIQAASEPKVPVGVPVHSLVFNR